MLVRGYMDGRKGNEQKEEARPAVSKGSRRGWKGGSRGRAEDCRGGSEVADPGQEVEAPGRGAEEDLRRATVAVRWGVGGGTVEAEERWVNAFAFACACAFLAVSACGRGCVA